MALSKAGILNGTRVRGLIIALALSGSPGSVFAQEVSSEENRQANGVIIENESGVVDVASPRQAPPSAPTSRAIPTPTPLAAQKPKTVETGSATKPLPVKTSSATDPAAGSKAAIVTAPAAASAPPLSRTAKPDAARRVVGDTANSKSHKMPSAPEPSDKLMQVELVALPQDGGKALALTGEIAKGGFNKVKRLIEANPDVKTLVLSSGGGLVLEGALIGRFIQNRGLTTRVDQVCLSACTLIMAGGADRIIAPGARLGFHKSSNRGTLMMLPDEEGISLGDTMVRQSLERSGVAPAFITKALSTQSSTFWYPSESEMLAAKFLTKPSTGIVARTGDAGPREAIRTQMLAAPLWQSAHKANPDLFELTVDQAWLHRAMGKNADDSIGEARRVSETQLKNSLDRMPDAVIVSIIAHDVEQLRVAKEAGKVCELKNRQNDADFLVMFGAPQQDNPMTEEQANAAMADFTVLAIADGKIDMEAMGTTTKKDRKRDPSGCVAKLAFMDHLTSLPEKEQARLMRATAVQSRAKLAKLVKLLGGLVPSLQ